MEPNITDLLSSARTSGPNKHIVIRENKAESLSRLHRDTVDRKYARKLFVNREKTLEGKGRK
jgi:hypothetical protein